MPEKSPFCIALALANARKGRFKHGFAFAGKNAYRIDKIISVKELIHTLKMEFSLASEYARTAMMPLVTDQCCAMNT